MLRLKRKKQPRRKYISLLKKFRRGRNLSPYFIKFSKLFFNTYFLCLQKNLNLNLNFFKTEYIESYTFQLYFMLNTLLKLKKIFTRRGYNRRRRTKKR